MKKPLPMQPGVQLVVRHGICSNSQNMQPLALALQASLGLPVGSVDNQSYNWKETVLRNGVELAADLVAAPAADGVILVGHSMGGLVCRVANLALTDANFPSVLRNYALKFGFRKKDYDAVEKLLPLAGKVRVRAVVTLATPNSGAMTKSQIAMAVNVLVLIGTPFVLWPLGFKSQGIADLSTERLFRIFQHCHTTTPCLTISGSWGNRFIHGAGARTANRILKWTASLREPHDKIVEDISVDLGQSILRHEFTTPPKHERLYTDCINVEHTNIHGNAFVQNLAAGFIRAHP